MCRTCTRRSVEAPINKVFKSDFTDGQRILGKRLLTETVLHLLSKIGNWKPAIELILGTV
jgi:hypothetical protein